MCILPEVIPLDLLMKSGPRLMQKLAIAAAVGLVFFSFLLCTRQAAAQTPDRIEGDLRAIESAAARHATDDELGKLWGQLASDYVDEMDLAQAEKAYDHALKLLRGSIASRGYYAMALGGVASVYTLTGRPTESENCRRKALAIFEEEGDRKNVDMLHSDLALSMMKNGELKEAEKEASKAIEGMLGQASPDTNDLIAVLVTRGYVRCFQHRCKEGLADAEHAIDIVRVSLRPNLLAAAAAWMALGYMEWRTSDVAGAEEKMRRALQILSEKSELPYPTVVHARIEALKHYQEFLEGIHRTAEARQAGDEIARLTRAQTPTCRNCTVNVEGLSNARH